MPPDTDKPPVLYDRYIINGPHRFNRTRPHRRRWWHYRRHTR